MCLGIPMKICKLNESTALVDSQGVKREVSILLVSHEKLIVGDWLMIHVGYAIGKIDEREAKETLGILEKLMEPPEQGNLVI